jgi:lysyl-tRNA synthetase class 2
MDRIYQIGPCFREGESGSRHSQEFTMLEWYRRGATYMEVKADLRRLYKELSGKDVQFRDVLVRDAYIEYAGWDPWAEWDQDRFDFDMATKVEPAIKAAGGGLFLVDYPPQAASLARVSVDGSSGLPRAERWEFYFDGLELANCFTELCDRDEQARRFEAARENRRALGESEYPLDEGFLDSLPSIGSASGAALGVDRLVMVLSGVKEISAVRPKI